MATLELGPQPVTEELGWLRGEVTESAHPRVDFDPLRRQVKVTFRSNLTTWRCHTEVLTQSDQCDAVLVLPQCIDTVLTSM